MAETLQPVMVGNAPRVENLESPWQNAVIYQVYPRSFKESAEPGLARGEGNLRGITEQIQNGYIGEIADAIWISPFFKSPMLDGGYDVADYQSIDPRYGTLEDFDQLIAEAHQRGLKVIIDFIPNHTSDQHAWFQESRLSHDNPKSDWYIWRDPAPHGGPPNNWASVFSLPQKLARERGELNLADDEPTPPLSAWKFDEQRGQYYLHSFGDCQPDLNWNNPEVREAMKAIMCFWADRGIDGSRVDAVNYIGKNHPDFPDEAPNPNYREGVDNPYDSLIRFHSANYPGTFYPWIKEVTTVLEQPKYADRNLRIIFEAYMDKEDLAKIDAVAPRVAGTFNFTRLDVGWGSARQHQQLLDGYHANLLPDSIPNQVNGNHDKDRLATRIGARAARAAAVVNLTLPGMIFVYNGEEGNFENVVIPEERQDDVMGGRDPERTPMPWTGDDPHAGFSPADPEDFWLPMTPDFQIVNLAAQAKDPQSTLNLYRALVRLRRTDAALRFGAYHPLAADNPDVLTFSRRHNGNQIATVVNFSDQLTTARVFRAEQRMGRIVISSATVEDGRIVDLEEGVTLRPHEGVTIVRSA